MKILKKFTVVFLILTIFGNLQVFGDTWVVRSDDGSFSPYTVTNDYVIVNDKPFIKVRDFLNNFSNAWDEHKNREITEDNTANIDWEEETKTIKINEHFKITEITANEKIMKITDIDTGEVREVILDEPAQIIDGHFCIPPEGMGEIYGLDFVWDEDEKVIYICS